MSALSVPIEVLPHGHDLPLPFAATSGAAGYDLSAALEGPLELLPMSRALIPTGIAVALPPGYEGQVRPRSGLAWKHGVTIVNAPGTVDSDYRGEIKVHLINLGQSPFTLQRGDRIAQLVVAPVATVAWVSVPSLDQTVRGQDGFGSTGVGTALNLHSGRGT